MPTIKEQLDLIQQNQEENEQLEKELQDTLYEQQDLISTGLKNNLSATKSSDGYTIKMTPQNVKHNPYNSYNAYEIIIEEPFKSRDPLRYVKAIVKKVPKVFIANYSIFVARFKKIINGLTTVKLSNTSQKPLVFRKDTTY